MGGCERRCDSSSSSLTFALDLFQSCPSVRVDGGVDDGLVQELQRQGETRIALSLTNLSRELVRSLQNASLIAQDKREEEEGKKQKQTNNIALFPLPSSLYVSPVIPLSMSSSISISLLRSHTLGHWAGEQQAMG